MSGRHISVPHRMEDNDRMAFGKRTFSDHFSRIAASYAAFRPRYPATLFEFLRATTARRELAWDCATGTGQAAVALTAHYARVVATDASAAQIGQASTHPRVTYSVAPAHASGLASHTVDLVTVAQALHWFDTDAFYTEVNRVLVPGGVLAAWAYGRMMLDCPDTQHAVDHLYEEVLGAYWPAERRLVESGYRTLPFPYDEIAAPTFDMRAEMSAAQLEGYLRTWSATQRFIQAHGHDPVAELQLQDVGTFPLQVRWPIALRIGRARDIE